MKKSQIIAINFDGTMVEHNFPRIGKPVPFAINVCKRLIRAGHKIMLWTMRSDNHTSWNKPKQQSFENMLTEAVKYMQDNGIDLWGINENPEQNWSSSNKQYANLYIDDMALGCPLVTELWDNDGNKTILNNSNINWLEVDKLILHRGYTLGKPYVNWIKVDKLLLLQGYYDRTSYQITHSHSQFQKKLMCMRNEIIMELMDILKGYFEDVFLAQTYDPEISTWYKGAGLYVNYELIVSSELLDDEDTDITFIIGDKEFSITCHNN